jgi:hypothetical protein
MPGPTTFGSLTGESFLFGPPVTGVECGDLEPLVTGVDECGDFGPSAFGLVPGLVVVLLLRGVEVLSFAPNMGNLGRPNF